VLPPWGLIWELLDFTKKPQYDIAHIVAPLCLSFLLILPLLKLRQIKIYVSYHVYLEYYKHLYIGSNPLLDIFAEYAFTLLYFIPLVYFADCVGIPSKTADSYVFKYSKRIHYLKSGLDTTNVFVPQSLALKNNPKCISNLKDIAKTSGPMLIYVGRLAVEKNVEFLMASLAHPLLSDATLVIVGDGPCRSSLEEMANGLVGAEHVHQVAEYYRQSDIFVSASGSETFGFTVAEAMACATPAVVVREGAFRTVYRMIDDWMFEEGDMNAYAQTIVGIMERREVSMQRARQVAVDGFGMESAIDDLLDAYRWIVDGCETLVSTKCH
jgi:glycosyltransferase involved in cell wall biosynthesis